MPHGSRRMCGTGFSVIWPPRSAVSSPPSLATKACDASWHVVENRKATYQMHPTTSVPALMSGMLFVPRRAALMALAGPAANFTLMIIAAILIRIGNGSGWFVPGVSGQPGILGVVLEAFFRLNLLLGIFNLFPAPPLDGSTGIMVFMGDGTAQRYLHWLRTTPYRSLGLLAAVLAFRYFYGPVETFATNLMIHTKF